MIEETEPGYFNFDSFAEVKDFYTSLFDREKITTLYKIRYRKEEYHKEFLSDGQIYFSKPSQLNDSFDINRPLSFDTSIIDTPDFFQKLIDYAPVMFKVNPGRDAKAVAKNNLDLIKSNPEDFFLKAYEGIINDSQYDDQIGIFSLTYNILNDNLWGYYGGGLKGYAVGFDPLKLAEIIFPSTGQLVKYDDTIRASKILSDSLEETLGEWFTKFKR